VFATWLMAAPLFVSGTKATKLVKYEIPAKIKLLPDPGTPESRLVTNALKIKREQLKAKFKDDILKLHLTFCQCIV